MQPTLTWPTSPRLPADGRSVAGAELPPQPFWFPPLRTLRTEAVPLLPRSCWYSPFLMLPDTARSELNNNHGIAVCLGLGSLHEFFFRLSQCLRDKLPGSFPTWPSWGGTADWEELAQHRLNGDVRKPVLQTTVGATWYTPCPPRHQAPTAK